MLLDIGMGLIIAVFAAEVFGVELSFTIIVLSVIFGLLPDIDTPIELLQRGKLGGKKEGFHRKYTHYPILYFPIVLIISLAFGTFWATLFGLNILSHFIHDSFGTGWGLKWLGPFNHRRFKLFDNGKGEFILTPLLMSWNEEEYKNTIKNYGEENWFKMYYLRPSPIFLLEISIFLFGVIVLYLSN